VTVQVCTTKRISNSDVYWRQIGSTEGRLPLVSNGGVLLMRSACKTVILGVASVDGVSQNVKLGCFVLRIAAEVSKDPNGLFSAVS
jgi:hypothetical protein